MTEETPKEFGKRAPPVVLRKPQSSGAGERPPLTPEKRKRIAEPLKKPPRQKRSLAVSLAVMGALSLGAYETYDWINRKLNCEPDPANPGEQICKNRSGSTYRRSSNWHSSSGSGGSSSSHSSGGSTHGVSFGGFGHSGGFSGGG
jgi:hypothetical protein